MVDFHLFIKKIHFNIKIQPLSPIPLIEKQQDSQKKNVSYIFLAKKQFIRMFFLVYSLFSNHKFH